MKHDEKEIIATVWYKPMVVRKNGNIHLLVDWCARDHGMPEMDTEWTWGYFGSGPASTAYSILREFFGSEAAEEYCSQFLRDYVGKLDEKKGFTIDRKTAAKMLRVSGWVDG